MLRVGIVANEPSGDSLGASLMKAMASMHSDISFEGVGGPQMIELGCKSLVEMEKLSVMGLVEVVKHLPELLSIRKKLLTHFIENPPDVFIGIDAPDFNLPLESKLKKVGVPTVHYVCPTVWAWRSGRVKTIRKSCDLVLSIFPFEKAFLEPHGVRAAYVGHSLADEIPLQSDRQAAKQDLNLKPEIRYIALLPGSRLSEIETLARTFLETAKLLHARYPEWGYVVPLINPRVSERFQQIALEGAPELPITLISGQSRAVMQAADMVLTASGTATLEALLLKRPMVVAYRLNALTYWIVNTFNLVKVPYVSMANLLSEKPLAQEFIQDAAAPEALADALGQLIESPERVERIESEYYKLHLGLQQNAGQKAAEAVLKLVNSGV